MQSQGLSLNQGQLISSVLSRSGGGVQLVLSVISVESHSMRIVQIHVERRKVK